MWIIMLAGVVGILLLDFTGAIPQSSVGGPLTLVLIFFLAMLAAGIHDAWSNRRGVLGWIVSIACAIIGGFAAVRLGALVLEALLPYLDLNGPLATSDHPMRYVADAGLMILTLLGSWLALRIVNRLR